MSPVWRVTVKTLCNNVTMPPVWTVTVKTVCYNVTSTLSTVEPQKQVGTVWCSDFTLPDAHAYRFHARTLFWAPHATLTQQASSLA